MRYLVLYLAGPLQAWGADSRFDLRETLPYPTKSGIFGMLLAASGDSGPQTELLEQMAANIRMTVYCFKNAGRLHDFHVVGNGYNEKDPWESLNIPRKSDGAKVGGSGGGAKLTHRYYLQDAAFCVILQMPDDLAEKFSDALQNPVYDLYLGRKCCVPSVMIYQGNMQTEAEAKSKVRQLAEIHKLELEKKISELTEKQPGCILLNDVPVEFGLHRRYRDRWIMTDPCTMEEL